MSKQSKWLVCGKCDRSGRWIILASTAPMLSPEPFYRAIERHRRRYKHFGVHVSPAEAPTYMTYVDAKEVRTIDEIFLDKRQVLTAEDILEGMYFTRTIAGKEQSAVVLAQREGYVMIRKGTLPPELIFWQDLLHQYQLNDKIR